MDDDLKVPEQCQQIDRDTVAVEISFMSDNKICRGVYYRPSSNDIIYSRTGQPCVILAHGFGGTVDAGLHPYARAFAESGFHALVFDYRHFGLSDGSPRQLLSIGRQTRDWHAAIDFARTLKNVDPNRIILWGVSLSGGHVIRVAARDEKICAVIAQFPMLDGLAALRNVYNYAGYAQILSLVAAGVKDLLLSLLGRGTRMIPIVGLPGELAALSTSDAEPGYKAIVPPDWVNAVCARIALSIPFYRPGFLLKRIASPIFIQIADNDSLLPLSSIQRFVPSSHSNIWIKHYQSGHFDAFRGELFQRAVNDQISFMLKAMDANCYENNTT